MHSILGETPMESEQAEFVITQEQAAQQDIVLKRSGYQDYVIPRAVSASVAALATNSDWSGFSCHRLEAYMTTRKSDKPYVSTVFGRESGSGDLYLELCTNEMKLEEGSHQEIIITVVGAEDQSAEYFISQDEDHQVSIFTGTISYRYATKAVAKKTKLNYILSIAAENGNLAYVMDVDGDLATTDDINVYKVSTFTTTAFNKGENDTAYSYAAFAQKGGSDVLFVSDMSNIYYREDYQTKSVFESGRSISGNINILPGENGPIILWSETVDGADELYMVYDNGISWTKPVMISRQSRTLRDVHATVFDGMVVGVCNCDNDQESTDLSFFEIRGFTDLAVADYIYFDESAAIPGQDCSFDVMVSNQGTTRIDDVSFTVTDGLGYTHTVTEALYLYPGDVTRVTLSYPVSDHHTATTLTVSASADEMEDTDLTNNTVLTEIGKPDLSVREESIHIVDGGYVLNVSIENLGIADAGNVVLDVRLEENAADPVYTQTVGSLDRKTSAVVNVGIPSDQLIFDEDGVARVYMDDASSSEDAAAADNRLCILIAKPEEKQCAHCVAETVSGSEPDCDTPGCTPGEACAACGLTLTESEILPALDHDFVNGICTRCGIANNPFTDVPEGLFYFEPVLWAVEKGITNGATATTFNPGGVCVRGHVVTFLWRAMGSPEPTSTANPFVDVRSEDFFYKPVLWAVENGITNGMGDGTFGVLTNCNRAQVVTFLYRCYSKP